MTQTTTKASAGVLKVRPTGSGSYTALDSTFGRGVINASLVQRTQARANAAGRMIQRRLNIFDAVITTDLRDVAATRRLFGWLAGNNRIFDVQWFPEGEATGKLLRQFTGPIQLEAVLGTDRVINLTITASGPVTDTTVSSSSAQAKTK